MKIIREDEDGYKRVIMMNLNDRDVIFNPNFYLQQNDVIYVEPNKVKAQNSEIGSATNMVVGDIDLDFCGNVVNQYLKVIE